MVPPMAPLDRARVPLRNLGCESMVVRGGRGNVIATLAAGSFMMWDVIDARRLPHLTSVLHMAVKRGIHPHLCKRGSQIAS